MSDSRPEQTIADLLAQDRILHSFEFMPPRDEEDVYRLWRATDALVPLAPDFVSVTYGADGSRRDRTLRCTEHMVTTGLRTMGHLTCVDQSRDQLEATVEGYRQAGVDHVLAIRGDMPGGAGQPWRAHPRGLSTATQLVRLVREVYPDACIGVAAFPDGHPDSGDLDLDARILVEKYEAGASFAITQLFLVADHWERLVERVRALGCDIPIIPGIMPVTSYRQIERISRLSGAELPEAVVSRLAQVRHDPVAARREGLLVATELCCRLLDAGAPGLHYFTLNRSTATTQLHAMVSAYRC